MGVGLTHKKTQLQKEERKQGVELQADFLFSTSECPCLPLRRPGFDFSNEEDDFWWGTWEADASRYL